MYKRLLNVVMSVLLLIIIIVAIKLLTDEATKTTATERQITVVIDPGHGGVDPGKVGVNGELEKELNLQISFELKKCLEEQGIQVVLTRETDEGLYDDDSSNKKASDMKKRCKIINETNPLATISIHQNSFTDGEVRGAQVFYYTHSDAGKKLAECIQGELVKIPDSYNDRPIKGNDKYYMLMNTVCPTVIVECGFLSNYEEAGKLSDENYQRQIAMSVMTGILDFIQNND